MNYFSDTFSTPFGSFSTAVDDRGRLAATAFGDAANLRQRLKVGQLTADKNAGRAARDEILAYCAGERWEFTTPLAPIGTPFQNRVWSALQNSVDLWDDFGVALLKSAVFGGTSALVAAYVGYHAEPTIEGTSVATTRAVVMDVVFIVILDMLFALFFEFVV